MEGRPRPRGKRISQPDKAQQFDGNGQYAVLGRPAMELGYLYRDTTQKRCIVVILMRECGEDRALLSQVVHLKVSLKIKINEANRPCAARMASAP